MAARRVTSREIAREAGVSQPTVSRALRGDPRVAPATAALVQTTARRLGYVPDAAARSLITGRTGTVALVVEDITNPFYAALVEALHEQLARAGYQAILLNERTDARVNGGITSLLRAGAVDGAIVATATLDEATAALLRDERTPIVLVVREAGGGVRDAVVCDNRRGGALAADLLADLGHRWIGVVAGPDDTSTARERGAGFNDALARRGITVEPDLWRAGDYSYRAGHQSCLELLDSPRPPTALFCANDVIALGALDAARLRGVAVPGALSLLGFDDIALAGWASFRLTTIRQPLAEMAREAARMMIRRVEEPAEAPPRRTVFPVELIVRATTGPRAPDGG